MPTYNNDNMATFVWVNSEREAMEYPVARNTGLLMMHRTEPIVYMKQTDAYGRALPLEVYELKKREPQEAKAPVYASAEDLKNYVRTDDIAALVKAEFDKLMK